MSQIKKIADFIYELPIGYRDGMLVPGIIFADEELLQKALEDKGVEQVANVAAIPGVIRASMAMPDIHWGYGFPIGGVAAMGLEKGWISPGGVGFDINCGVRLLRSDLMAHEAKAKIKELAHELSRLVPKGVGRGGKIRAEKKELRQMMLRGAAWASEAGFGWPEDVEHIEEEGCLQGADTSCVSEKVFERGVNQPGTLGSGNHFVEIQRVDEIFNEKAAVTMGLFHDQVVAMVHSGSRGVGHQICTEYIPLMDQVSRREGLELPDRQLAAAPIRSVEGQNYFAAMACAVNFAFVNRQCLSHWVRTAFANVFGSWSAKSMRLVYDVCHNIAKFEDHTVEGRTQRVCVHRKGATRAFGPGHPGIPLRYREIGQPVLIPGDMGTESYVMVGAEKAMELSWGSACHGAGRLLSRAKAKKMERGDQLRRELEETGIIVEAGSVRLLSEEAPYAYKDVGRVVRVCEGAGLASRVAKLKPMAVIKG